MKKSSFPGPCPDRNRKRLILLILIITASVSLLSPLPPALADGITQITCVYDILVDNKKAGEMTLVRRPADKGGLCLELDSKIEITGWWGSWHLKSSQQVLTDQRGLLEFDHKITEDGKKWRISGDRHKDSLWCSARQVLTDQEKEDNALVGLAASAATNAIPYAGTALAAVNLLKGGEKGQGDVKIFTTLFDTTAIELPLFLVKNNDSLGNKSVQVLDTTELEIQTLAIQKKGMETLELAGKKFSCQTFAADSKDRKSVQWIFQDGLGGVLAKEKGKDKDGPYEIRLKSHEIINKKTKD